MRIVPIFDSRLYSFQYDEQNRKVEIEQLFDDWQNPEYLEEFFVAHQNLLRKDFFGLTEVEQAVLSTINEAGQLERKVMSLAKNDSITMEQLFKPLHVLGFEQHKFPAAKAYGTKRPTTWLRLYALRIEKGVYAITGGAIKLTRRMEDSENTLKELRRVVQCRDWLGERGVYDLDGFVELSCD